MRILILGAGYIGTFLDEKLSALGNFTILKSRKDLNYADFGVFHEWLEANPVECVINCAGYTDTQRAEQQRDLCWDLNVKVPLLVSMQCKLKGIELIHLSTGCVFSGYEKEYMETDEVNYGAQSPIAPWYNKSKDAYEKCSDYGLNLRIRYPYSDLVNPKSLLRKIQQYPLIYNATNSKTDLNSCAEFIHHALQQGSVSSIGAIHLVNPYPLSMMDICELLQEHKLGNPNWTYTDTLPNTSNCILSTEKLQTLFPDFSMPSEYQAISRLL